MANGLARASARRAKAQVKGGKQNTTDKWIGKKHMVEAGDIVAFHTPTPHMMGGMGTVVGYLDKNTVLIKTFGGVDSDYPPMFVGVRNQRANENYGGDDFQPHYNQYIKKVVHRMKPKPPKKRKPIRFYEVTPTVLPSVLSGEHAVPEGHKVVLVSEPEAEVVDLQAGAT